MHITGTTYKKHTRQLLKNVKRVAPSISKERTYVTRRNDL